MKKALHYLLFFLVIAPFYAQTIPSYYNGLDLTKTGDDLFLELSTRIIDTHSGIPYTGSPIDVWDACKEGDEDPDNSANVLLIYGYDDSDADVANDRTRDKSFQDTGSGASGVWNREHVYPKSLADPSFGTDEPGPGTDVHNLRPADRTRNSSRSNKMFSAGSGIASYATSDGGWYPGDEWKGDVARIIMYMYLRYDGAGSIVSETNCLPINVGKGTALTIDPKMIELFLTWNVEDPVSDFEDNRNNVLESYQGNRNPFIDNPYLATSIWGELAAENRWSNTSSDTEAPTEPSNVNASNITDESFDLNWNASTDNTEVYEYLVYLNGEYILTSKTTDASITNLEGETSYIVTIKARDLYSNYSNASTALNVETLKGPRVLFEETFEDCVTIQFNTYSEASSKDWSCSETYGEDSSGSMSMNGYLEAEASKDWLITNTPINFDAETGEKISFYAAEKYGSTPLELVVSANYDGTSNPANYTWAAVPNVTIPLPINNSPTDVEEVYTFSDIDISEIRGTVYIAFKYYSDGNPTRWTIDNFEITAGEQSDDVDEDGVLNADDLCPNTPLGAEVDSNGCSTGQLDDDKDGVQNSDDTCADTPADEDVNASGCSESQIDDDEDGVMNDVDECENTPIGEAVDEKGCSESQLDDDGDGVMNDKDQCPNTPTGVNVDGIGCFTLNSDNFKVETISETCAGSSNGKIIITAVEDLNYSTTIDGDLYNFSNSDGLEVENLAATNYEFCISVEGESYKQCYNVIIEVGAKLTGKIALKSSNKATIEVSKGTAPFNVLVNGIEQFQTSAPIFTVDVTHGDLVEVKTAIECEGKLAKQVDLFEEIIAYPNPTKGAIAISLPISEKEVTIEVYNIHSQLISSKVYLVEYGRVKLNIEEQPTGVYIAKVLLESPILLKIMKN